MPGSSTTGWMSKTNLLIVVVILVVTALVFTSISIITKTNEGTEPIFSDWTQCIDGKHTRTVLTAGTGTKQTVEPSSLFEPCSYPMFSEWNRCENNMTTRTLIKYGTGSEMTHKPEDLYMECVPRKYSAWTPCHGGSNSRVVVQEAVPHDPEPPVLSQPCSQPVLSTWGPCIDDIKTRHIITPSYGENKQMPLTSPCTQDARSPETDHASIVYMVENMLNTGQTPSLIDKTNG